MSENMDTPVKQYVLCRLNELELADLTGETLADDICLLLKNYPKFHRLDPVTKCHIIHMVRTHLISQVMYEVSKVEQQLVPVREID